MKRSAYGANFFTVKRSLLRVPAPKGLGKTLAKVANKLAKKSAKAKGVLNLLNSPYIDLALQKTEIADVWGVGSSFTQMLLASGIENAYQLKNADENWVRKQRGIAGLRTVLELRGISCIPLEEMPNSPKSTAVTRSFGDAIETLSELQEALSFFASRAGEKLRKQKLATANIVVFFQTGFYDKQNAFRKWSATINLFESTNDSRQLVASVRKTAAELFEPGYKLKKAGVILLGLTPESERQMSLFSQNADNSRSLALMQVVDAINAKYGSQTIQLAASGVNKKWRSRAEKLSPRYTTDWNDLPTIG